MEQNRKKNSGNQCKLKHTGEGNAHQLLRTERVHVFCLFCFSVEYSVQPLSPAILPPTKLTGVIPASFKSFARPLPDGGVGISEFRRGIRTSSAVSLKEARKSESLLLGGWKSEDTSAAAAVATAGGGGGGSNGRLPSASHIHSAEVPKKTKNNNNETMNLIDQ